jgi:hypothetical protein
VEEKRRIGRRNKRKRKRRKKQEEKREEGWLRCSVATQCSKKNKKRLAAL